MRLITITLTILAAAVLATVVQAEDASKRSPELQVLDRFVGTWDVEVSVKPAGEAATTYNAISTRSWSQRGTFIHFDDPNPERPEEPEFQMLLTYDPEARNYPGVMMMGSSRSQITGTWDEKTKAMSFEATLPDGNKLTSTHRFVDENHADPSGVITDSDGKVLLELSWKQTRRQKAAQAAGETVDAIIAKQLKAIGGAAAYKRLATRKSTGTMSLTGIGGPWQFAATQKVPNLVHVSIDIPNVGVATEGFDGKVAWKNEPGSEVRQLKGQELQQKQREAFFYRYVDLRNQFKTLTYRRRETVKGTAYDVLDGVYEDGAEESVYIDAETHLVGLVRVSAGTETISIDVSDYKEVDGVQLAHSWVASSGTGPFITIGLDKITHGVKVDEALFAMPTD